jgi:hypothetical protein
MTNNNKLFYMSHKLVLNEQRLLKRLAILSTKLAKPEAAVFENDSWQEPYEKFLKEWEKKTGKLVKYGDITDWPLVKFNSGQRDRNILVMTGVHGEEQVGPLTVLSNFDKIVDIAARAGIGITIYPCFSPTGWGVGERDNIRNSATNNVIEYLSKETGKFTKETHRDNYTDVRMSEDAAKEAQDFYEDVMNNPIPDAALDIHQDSDLKKKNLKPSTYAYVYKPEELRHIAQAATRYLQPAAGQKVELYDVEHSKGTVDKDGLLICSDIDNTTQGFFEHLQIPYTCTLETSLNAPLDKVDQVNMTWISGLIDLLAQD